MSVKIALDAGHGLNTVGKQTPDGIKEWSLNDKVRDKIVAFLSDYDCEIIHTDNDEGVTDESLAYRLNKYLSAGADVFVSLHHNAFKGTWNGVKGVEVYVDKNHTEADMRLAKCIFERLVEYTGLVGRGIKSENFAVINQNKIPAVLVEGGFMDGESDYKVITSEEGQLSYAKAVADGLIEFLGLKKKPVGTPEKISVIYQVWDGVRKAWLPNVTDLTDYAGIFDNDVCAVYANLIEGDCVYKVHTQGGSWLPEVKNRTDYAGIFNKPIDAFMIKAIDPNVQIYYQVHIRGGNWLPYVTGYNVSDGDNGYAGILGKPIDGIRMYAKKTIVQTVTIPTSQPTPTPVQPEVIPTTPATAEPEKKEENVEVKPEVGLAPETDTNPDIEVSPEINVESEEKVEINNNDKINTFVTIIITVLKKLAQIFLNKFKNKGE